jgi:hypothetical protein
MHQPSHEFETRFISKREAPIMFLPWRCLRWEHRCQRSNLTKRLGDRILKEQTKRVEVALNLAAGDFAMNQQLVL